MYRPLRPAPKKKDYFVPAAFGPELSGIPERALGPMSGLDVHEIESTEYDPGTRVVNFRRGFGTLVAQHAVVLYDGPLGGSLGETCATRTCGALPPGERAGQTPRGDPHWRPRMGTPGQHASIWVDRSAHDGPAALAVTVAHELLHGVSVDHHGENVFTFSKICRVGSTYLGMTESACAARGGTFKEKWSFAGRHGEFAGDQRCPMIYDGEVGWIASESRSVTLADIQPETLKFSRAGPWKVCTSPAGTHFNAGDAHVGDARRGNCQDQIRVCDAPH